MSDEAAQDAARSRPLIRPAPDDERPVVHTTLGRVRGVRERGVIVYRGIRYAQPPVGPLRFRPPLAAQPWSGVLEAGEFAAAPMQPHDPSVGLSADQMSEDCLALNIWAPATAGPHPVLVWIHGGGQTIGGTRLPAYDGTTFARAGVVCVTVGYRLGALGFLELGGLLGEAYEGSANNALRDLTLALQWVHDHIADFGGNPARVTLGGESAGAKNAATLLGVAAARGLFHRLVVMSGGAHTVQTPSDANAVAGCVLAAAGLSSRTAKRLLELPAGELLEAQESVVREWGRRFALRPVIDGDFLAAPLLEQLCSGAAPTLPLLIGTSRDECASLADEVPAAPLPGKFLAHVSPDDFAAMEARYAVALPSLSPIDRRAQALTAEEYWLPSVRLAEAFATQGAPVWMYRHDLPADAQGRAGHVTDLPLWWWNEPHLNRMTFRGWRPLARAMNQALADFVCGHTLDLTLPDLSWFRYEPSERCTLIWNEQIELTQDPAGEARRLWDGLLT